MADEEEIIVDSMDVSECKIYNLKTKKCTIPCKIGYIKCTGLTCSDIKDCYFKQSKRAEQKLEKIKDYCLKNKVAGWVDIEGIVEIIEGKENDR